MHLSLEFRGDSSSGYCDFMSAPGSKVWKGFLPKFVSGGQTGVDRAALDTAMEFGLEVGGWCPSDRRAEDGVIDDKYPLSETEARNYSVRTRWNVRDSDGTLIIAPSPLTGGTAYTVKIAEKLIKPLLVIDPLTSVRDVTALREWVLAKEIKVLNVAGPRGSAQFEGIGSYDHAMRFLRETIRSWLLLDKNGVDIGDNGAVSKNDLNYALVEAADTADRRRAEMLLYQGADLDFQDKHGSLLDHAVMSIGCVGEHSIEMISFLLHLGVDSKLSTSSMELLLSSRFSCAADAVGLFSEFGKTIGGAE